MRGAEVESAFLTWLRNLPLVMEYDSFRALGYCHEQVKHRPNYVKAAQDDKILTFSELVSW